MDGVWATLWGVWALGAVLVAGGIAYLVLALRAAIRGLPVRSPLNPGALPGVTILVPAHGAPPRLAECLRSICAQRWPELQVVFGLHGGGDAAEPVIRAILAEHPELDAEVVINPRRIGTNPKNANLANMVPAAKHELLVMIDSDVVLAPDFLPRFVAPFADARVGGATCVYTGSSSGGFWSNLGALFHNDWFAGSVLVDLAGRMDALDICYGAAIGVRAAALASIGGFEAMGNAVAQDYVIGHDLARAGWKVALSSCSVATVVDEPDLRTLFRHELRWNRATRAVRPIEHALSIFMSPLLPGGLLMALGLGLGLGAAAATATVLLLALHLLLRRLLHGAIREVFPSAPAPWLLPVREIFSAVVWASAFFGRNVWWGTRVMRTGHGLVMRDEAPRG